MVSILLKSLKKKQINHIKPTTQIDHYFTLILNLIRQYARQNKTKKINYI